MHTFYLIHRKRSPFPKGKACFSLRFTKKDILTKTSHSDFSQWEFCSFISYKK